MTEKIFKIGIILFLMVFFGLLFAQQTGFYKNEIQEDIELTNEQIKKFEEDIKLGKEIDIEDYKVKRVDYSNKLSKGIYDTSLKLEILVDKTLKFIFKGATSLVSDK